MRELPVPPAAESAAQAIELARVWAADGAQHVTLETRLWADPGAWGLMLVDLARHFASAYEQAGTVSRVDALARIREAFDAEWSSRGVGRSHRSSAMTSWLHHRETTTEANSPATLSNNSRRLLPRTRPHTSTPALHPLTGQPIGASYEITEYLFESYYDDDSNRIETREMEVASLDWVRVVHNDVGEP